MPFFSLPHVDHLKIIDELKQKKNKFENFKPEFQCKINDGKSQSIFYATQIGLRCVKKQLFS